MSLSHLRHIAPKDKTEQIADRFLKLGYIQGPDYADLTSEKTFKLWGAEDKRLYFKSLKLYRALKNQRDHSNAYLDKLDQIGRASCRERV